MSAADAEDLLDVVNAAGDNVERRVGLLLALKARFKRERVDDDAIPIFVRAFSAALHSINSQQVSATLQCMGHFFKRLSFQPHSHLPKANHASLAHVVASKLGDKDKVADAAVTALLELWKLVPVPVEFEIKEAGFQSRQWRARQRSLVWLHKLKAHNPDVAIRAYTPYLISCLEDATEAVRELSHAVVVDFFKDTSDAAKTDLKLQMQRANVRKSVYQSVLLSIGIPEEHHPPPQQTAEPRSHTSMLVPIKGEDAPASRINRKNSRSLSESVPASAASTYVGSISGSEMEVMDVADVSGAHDLEVQFMSMEPAFKGRESEENWGQREKHIVHIRKLLRGNAVHDHFKLFLDLLRQNLDGIMKAFNSLRTTLSIHGCQLIKELATVCGTAVDFAVDIFLAGLIKMAATTKKITSNAANVTTAVLLSKTSYHGKMAQFIWQAVQDKNVQPRQYAPMWICVILESHADSSGYMESSNGIQLIEKSLQKLLGDANVTVREKAREAYWVYAAFWPSRSESLMASLDMNVRKQLNKVAPSANGKHTPTASVSAQARSSARATPHKRSDSLGTRLGLSSGAVRRGLSIQRPASAQGVERPPSSMSSSSKRQIDSPSRSTSTRTPAADLNSPASAKLLGSSSPQVRPAVTPNRANSSQQSLGIIDQLKHQDSSVRADGVVALMCAFMKKPVKHADEKPPSVPPLETLMPALRDIVDDSDPGVTVHLFAPEVFPEIAKLVPMESMLPRLLLMSEGGAGSSSDLAGHTDTTMHLAKECLPLVKKLLSDAEAAALLFNVLMRVSASGVVPRKMADSRFTAPQKRLIMHGLLLWIDELLSSHLDQILRGERGNAYLMEASNYRLYVNRIVPLITKTKPESINYVPMATVLRKLESVDEQTFNKVLITFERDTVKKLKAAWGCNTDDDTTNLAANEPVATVERVLGTVPVIDGAHQGDALSGIMGDGACEKSGEMMSSTERAEMENEDIRVEEPQIEPSPADELEAQAERPEGHIENQSALPSPALPSPGAAQAFYAARNDESDEDESILEDHENMTMIPAVFEALHVTNAPHSEWLQPNRPAPKKPEQAVRQVNSEANIMVSKPISESGEKQSLNSAESASIPESDKPDSHYPLNREETPSQAEEAVSLEKAGLSSEESTQPPATRSSWPETPPPKGFVTDGRWLDSRLTPTSGSPLPDSAQKLRVSLELMITRLEHGQSDSYTLRKLSRIAKERPHKRDMNARPIWDAGLIARLLLVLRQMLADEPYYVSGESPQQLYNTLLLLRHVIHNQWLLVAPHSSPVFTAVLDMRRRDAPASVMAGADEILFDLAGRMEPLQVLDNVSTYLRENINRLRMKQHNAHVVLALEAMAKAGAKMGIHDAQDAIRQLASSILVALDAKDAEVRHAAVGVCVALMKAMQDMGFAFDTLVGLPREKRDLLSLYYSRDRGFA